jgi:hypothetical protein
MFVRLRRLATKELGLVESCKFVGRKLMHKGGFAHEREL